MYYLPMYDDYPINFPIHRHHSRRRVPFLTSLLDSLQDERDLRAREVFRRLPDVLMGLERNTDPRSSRGLMSEAFSRENDRSAAVTTKDNQFQVHMDASHFQPDDISVKIVDGYIEIAAKHETKGDNDYEFHEIYRKFNIPEGVDPDALTSRLSPDGHLYIEAPMKSVQRSVKEISVVVEKEKEKSVTEPTSEKSNS